MNEISPIEEIKEQSSQKGKDGATRRLLIILVALWLLTVAAFGVVVWNAYFNEKEKSQTLAQQIAFACDHGDFGPGVSPEDVKALCENADAVIKDDGEVQEGEIQESETQDPELQNPEVQEPEIQDRENQNQENQEPEIQNPEDPDSENQESENQDPESQDPEIQDEESQDPEIQDDENQDPEIDDPDPNDQIQSGSCTFDGFGTITFTFQTSSGPVSFQCTGTLPKPLLRR